MNFIWWWWWWWWQWQWQWQWRRRGWWWWWFVASCVWRSILRDRMQSWLIGFGQSSLGDPRKRKFFTNSDGSWTKCSVNCNIWGRSSGVWWILVALFFSPGWSIVFLAPRQEIHLTPAARPVVAERVWELGGMDLGLFETWTWQFWMVFDGTWW